MSHNTSNFIKPTGRDIWRDNIVQVNKAHQGATLPRDGLPVTFEAPRLALSVIANGRRYIFEADLVAGIVQGSEEGDAFTTWQADIVDLHDLAREAWRVLDFLDRMERAQC